MAVEPVHQRSGEEIALDIIRPAALRRDRAGDRIDQPQRRDRHRRRFIARVDPREQSQIGPRAVPDQHQPRRFPTDLRRIRRQPPRRGDRVVRPGGEGMFGRQPVIDRHDRQIEHPRQVRAQWRMAVDIADHEPAAVEEHHQIARPTLASDVEQPRIDLAQRPRNREIPHQPKLALVNLHQRPRRLAPGPRLRRIERMHRRPRRVLDHLEQGGDIGADEWRGHAAPCAKSKSVRHHRHSHSMQRRRPERFRTKPRSRQEATKPTPPLRAFLPPSCLRVKNLAQRRREAPG